MHLHTPAEHAPKPRTTRRHWFFGSVLAVIAIGLFAAPFISDYAVMASADPAMVALSDKAGMNETGKKIFLQTRPQYVDVEGIKAHCEGSNTSGTHHVMGCYLPSENRIYLRNLDSRLDDAEVSTAAHEMLHAAYAQMSQDERQVIDNQVNQAAVALGPRGLGEEIAGYNASSDADKINELHSFIGSEYEEIPAALEQHYARYFLARTKSIESHKATEATFSQLEMALDSYKANYETSEAIADSYYQKHAAAANFGDAYNADYYYDAYVSEKNAAARKIDEYNAKVDEYNALAALFNGEPIKTQ